MKALLTTAGGLAALAILFACGIGAARADEDKPSFHVHNNLDQTVGVWVASEKSTDANPWTHIDVAPNEDATFTLSAPDRFIIAVDIGNQRSRSKPVALKAFLAKHPDYAMKLNLYVDNTVGADVNAPPKPPIYDFDFVPTKPSDDNSTKQPDAKTPPVKIPHFAFRDNDGKVWFRVHNNLDETVGVWAASEKSAQPENPWGHVDAEPGKEASFTLLAPDRYTLAFDIGKQRYRSQPIALKAFLDDHPECTLEINLARPTGAPSDAPPKYTFSFSPVAATFDDDSAQKPDEKAPAVEIPKLEFKAEPLPDDNQ